MSAHNASIITSGTTYGRLTIIEEVQQHRTPSNKVKRRFKVRCSCGVVFEVLLASLKSGFTKSCGCWRRECTSQRFKKKI